MFWKEKALDQMTAAEWESLCDGCALCCQVRVQDAGSGEMALTQAACRHLDHDTHRCGDYDNRQLNVPGCLKVTPENVYQLDWIPQTCAYRLVAHGYDLPDWHHLVCGDVRRVHVDVDGPSMHGELVNEDEFDWSDYE